MRLASHSPPATVRCTPSPHRACTPSTVALYFPPGDSHEPTSITVTLSVPNDSRSDLARDRDPELAPDVELVPAIDPMIWLSTVTRLGSSSGQGWPLGCSPVS